MLCLYALACVCVRIWLCVGDGELGYEVRFGFLYVGGWTKMLFVFISAMQNTALLPEEEIEGK